MTSSDDQLSVRATILLGELLHMVKKTKSKHKILICGVKYFMNLKNLLQNSIYVISPDSVSLISSSLLVLFRQTPSSLTPTVTTFTAFPPSSTWRPRLTSPKRNDCEFSLSRASVPPHEKTVITTNKRNYVRKYLHAKHESVARSTYADGL